MIGGNLLGVTCDGSVLEAYFWWLCTCVILDLSFVYLGLTWFFLTWWAVLLKRFSTYGSLSCQSRLQQVSLWTCLACEFLLQDFTNKTNIFSFSWIQDKILLNNSFLSGCILCIFEAFFMHFICIFYAFYMHFLCTFQKCMSFNQKCMSFWNVHIKCIKNAYKMHLKCIKNAYRMQIKCIWNSG